MHTLLQVYTLGDARTHHRHTENMPSYTNTHSMHSRIHTHTHRYIALLLALTCRKQGYNNTLNGFTLVYSLLLLLVEHRTEPGNAHKSMKTHRQASTHIRSTSHRLSPHKHAFKMKHISRLVEQRSCTKRAHIHTHGRRIPHHILQHSNHIGTTMSVMLARSGART